MHHGDKLSAIIRNGCWSLPRANSRSHHVDPLMVHWLSTFDPLPLNQGPDVLQWDGCDASKTKTWSIWNSLRFKGDLIPWHRVVWHRLRISRFAYHQWISCHRRLQTLARLHRFGLVDNQQCYLCSARETTTHIFLHYSYSRWILYNIMSTLGIALTGDSWINFIIHLADLTHMHKGTIALCYAQVFCYHIWRERNARAHNSGVFGRKKLLTGIKKDVIARLHSFVWFSKILDSRPDLIHCTSL
ncbi:uncharacterized protein LOC141680230 [Apium graveolens]|uniref:uncharacterized protein LOC141680230 n=1 Tax=Apium graveolens TaxID=4045 RepID=UPI003D7BF93A